MPNPTDLETAIRQFLPEPQVIHEGDIDMPAMLAQWLIGNGWPASPEDTIIVDAELDPETALDDSLAAWGRTALPGSNLTATVIAAEFVDAETRRHVVVVYNPDPEFSSIHAIGLLTAAQSAVRS